VQEYPCTIPLFLRGTRSVATIDDIANNPPPPAPATIRPIIMTYSFLASPQRAVPIKNSEFENRRPWRRPYISVSLPNKGCNAAWAIKYAVVIQESEAKELNSLDIGARRVEITVPSKAARNTPIYRRTLAPCQWKYGALHTQTDSSTAISFTTANSWSPGMSFVAVGGVRSGDSSSVLVSAWPVGSRGDIAALFLRIIVGDCRFSHIYVNLLKR